MHLSCKICQIPITEELELLSDQSLLCETEDQPYLPKGFYTIGDGEYFFNSKGKVIINIDDLVNCDYHPDYRRLTGCCGPSGIDGPNRICINGHEVATECSDCWMAHAIIVEGDTVEIN